MSTRSSCPRADPGPGHPEVLPRVETPAEVDKAAKWDWEVRSGLAQLTPATAKKNPRKTRMKNPKKNPHTSEWLVVQRAGARLNTKSLQHALGVLNSLGFGTRFKLRKTTQAGQPAVGVLLEKVNEVRVYPDIGNIAYIESLLSKFGHVEGYATQSRSNPAHDKRLPAMPRHEIGSYPDHEVIDPREEAIRAIARGTKGKWGAAKWRTQQWTPAQLIQRSWKRFQDPDKVIRDRQEYERQLGENRNSGPYRVTREPTTAGLRYFVWPLSEGYRRPVPFKTKGEAESYLEQQYGYDRVPAHSLPGKKYTKQELAEWLPPEAIFSERTGRKTRPAVEAEKRKRRVTEKKAVAPPLLQLYRDHSPLWYEDADLIKRYQAGKPPLKR